MSERQEKCPRCLGSGRVILFSHKAYYDCPKCHGTEELRKQRLEQIVKMIQSDPKLWEQLEVYF